ncbi:nucleotide pyrophosphohydrolase [Oxalobacter formigenes]|uniref:nucleotide pyrophosphohydrolase n=1 Tax=Oxalobacter formigenes TaxID=847 RepID=UPI00241C32F4|nr:nucleotide pyrophosphohydrolase [Oxalobacter formigenes]
MIDDRLLAEKLQRFSTDRDWDPFHTPKNIASALSVEASELLEIFQWTRGQHDWSEIDDDESVRTHVEEEVADILLYLIRFASLAKIDLQQAALDKMQKNAVKYPIESAKGSDRKYNE